MATPVELPRIGESVTEGTILQWLKNEGDFVEADEPLVEISTDKIDTELPAPVSGVLKQILVQPDQTVEVGAQIAVIDEGASKGEASAPAETAPAAAAPAEKDAAPGEKDSPKAPPAEKESAPAGKPAAAARPQQAPGGDGRAAATPARDERDRHAVLSPLVRKLAEQTGVDLATVEGTGPGGRITKQDVSNAAKGAAAAPAAATPAPAPAPAKPAATAAPAAARTAPSAAEGEQVEFTRVRRAIAEHMVRSRRTSAHVTDVVEVDMTAVAGVRDRAKSGFEKAEGFKLTFLPFISLAALGALREYPEFNAHLDPDSTHATLFREVNLGIAVARDEGLIVPVIHHADSLNLTGLARSINDIAHRARQKGGLKPDDVSGGTFTISNGGSYGSVIFTPIINQPQAAVLGLGAIRKVPAVISVDGSDAIAIRHRMFLCLSYDHRWIDGHKAVLFNSAVKRILEEADFAIELGAARPAGGE